MKSETMARCANCGQMFEGNIEQITRGMKAHLGYCKTTGFIKTLFTRAKA